MGTVVAGEVLEDSAFGFAKLIDGYTKREHGLCHESLEAVGEAKEAKDMVQCRLKDREDGSKSGGLCGCRLNIGIINALRIVSLQRRSSIAKGMIHTLNGGVRSIPSSWSCITVKRERSMVCSCDYWLWLAIGVKCPPDDLSIPVAVCDRFEIFKIVVLKLAL